MNPLKEKLAESLVIFDGAIGTEIYRRNFFINASFEQLSVTNPDVILDIHNEYLKAGAEVLTTNTFNANARRLSHFGLADQTVAINRAGVELARRAADGRALVAGSVGPVGEPESPADTASRRDLLIEQIGGAACHEGYRSCFSRELRDGKVSRCSELVFDPKEVYNG